jgi:hypothetical protein
LIERQTQASVPSAGKENDGKVFSLRGVVDRYEGDYAVLVFDDGQRLLWPKKQLPTGAREGVAVAIALTIDLMDTRQRSTRLKVLLTDING